MTFVRHLHNFALVLIVALAIPAAVGDESMPPIPMSRFHANESQGARPVQYLYSANERKPYVIEQKINPQTGQLELLDHLGHRIETSGSVFIENGIEQPRSRAMFVYGTDRKMYFSKFKKAMEFHHSSFLAGQPVLFAGEIEIHNGKLYGISNSSGHYKASIFQVHHMMKELEKSGFDLSSVTFYRDDMSSFKEFFDAKPTTIDIKSLSKYTLASFANESLGNVALMKHFSEHQKTIVSTLLDSPKSSLKFVNNLNVMLNAELEAIVKPALLKHREYLFHDVKRLNKLDYHFSKQTFLDASHSLALDYLHELKLNPTSKEKWQWLLTYSNAEEKIPEDLFRKSKRVSIHQQIDELFAQRFAAHSVDEIKAMRSKLIYARAAPGDWEAFLQKQMSTFKTKFKPIPMRSEYASETTRAREPVHYFSEAEVQKYKVKFSNGLLMDQTGDLITSYLTNPSIYVITPDGAMYLSRYQKQNLVQHSSIARGEPILSAGEIIVTEGKIKAINLLSGHYRPSHEYFDFLSEYFTGNKVELTETKMGNNAVTENIHLLKPDCNPASFIRQIID